MISLIAAIGKNSELGLNNKLPWHLPEDFAWFKSQTLGKPIIMGRKTFDSFGGKPLPKRHHIVISRTPQADTENVTWVSSLDDAIHTAKKITDDEIMVIGGGEIYNQSLTIVDRMYLTEVDLAPEADAFFPSFDKSKWQRTIIKEYAATHNQPAFTITQYDRI